MYCETILICQLRYVTFSKADNFPLLVERDEIKSFFLLIIVFQSA